MNKKRSPKLALAVITRRLDDAQTILSFLDNAHRYGHPIERVIVAYSHRVDPGVVAAIRRRARLDVLRATGDPNLRGRLLSAGLAEGMVDDLLSVPSWVPYREAPYSAYRNAVLLHTLLEGLDALIFVDTDVSPKVLTGVDGERPQFRGVDVVGTHLRSLSKKGILATTSDYSGYYIIPPMAFDGLEQLLVGLRKEKALDYLRACDRHHCLNFGPPEPGPAAPTNKPLGGNLGLKLRHPRRLTTFYSTTYVFQDRCIKGRGEDTLLGRAMARPGGQIVDVDLRLFHDTFPEFPAVPDMRSEMIRTRFYHACLGWIGRNPFLTWFLDRSGELGRPFDEAMQRQREGLRVGGLHAARAFDDPRFAELGQAFDAAHHQLPAAIRRYERLMAGWSAFLDALDPLPVQDGGELDPAFDDVMPNTHGPLAG